MTIREEVTQVHLEMKEHQEKYLQIKNKIEIEKKQLDQRLSTLQNECNHIISDCYDHYPETIDQDGYQKRVTFYCYQCKDCDFTFTDTKDPEDRKEELDELFKEEEGESTDHE
jgi:hypothetical protein